MILVVSPDVDEVEGVRIERLLGDDAAVRALLVDLELEEQERYDHPRRTRDEVARSQPPLRTTFVGENHLYVARAPDGTPLGVCWCVLYDPGTGLEGEVAELYVRPEARGRGLARRLVDEAMALFRERGVTFASVWSHPGNAAALAVYGAVGFRPTEQVVLTWLPVDRG